MLRNNLSGQIHILQHSGHLSPTATPHSTEAKQQYYVSFEPWHHLHEPLRLQYPIRKTIPKKLKMSTRKSAILVPKPK